MFLLHRAIAGANLQFALLLRAIVGSIARFPCSVA
jgi:hypothetical protein